MLSGISFLTPAKCPSNCPCGWKWSPKREGYHIKSHSWSSDSSLWQQNNSRTGHTSSAHVRIILCSALRYMRTEHLTCCTLPALRASVRLLRRENTCSCLIISELCSENHFDTFASWLWFLVYSPKPLITMLVFSSNFLSSCFATRRKKKNSPMYSKANKYAHTSLCCTIYN